MNSVTRYGLYAILAAGAFSLIVAVVILWLLLWLLL